MIRPIDIRLNAAHPELPLAEAVTFTGSPSTVLIRGVPPNCGRWAITAVFVAASFPDGSTTTRAAVQSANGVWVATLPATAASGRTANGIRVMADGIDENGEVVTGYILGVADFAVASLYVTPAPEPGETSYQMLYFDAVPSVLHKGDVTKIDGVLKFYNGSAWEPFAAPVTFDDSVTRTSENGVKSSGIWSALWGALNALPTGFSSLYDWVVDRLAGKAADNAVVKLTGDQTVGGEKTFTSPAIFNNGVTVYSGLSVEGMFGVSFGPNYGDGYWSITKDIDGNITLNISAGENSGTLTIPVNTGTLALVSQIPDVAARLQQIAAFPAFDATASYAVGDMVTYQGQIYECTTAHSGAWAVGDFTARTLGYLLGLKQTKITASGLLKGDGAGGVTPAVVGTDYAGMGNLPYTLGTPTVISAASSEVVSGETVYYGAATLADRTANIVQVTAATALDELRITFPAATSGKVRDFGLRVEIGTGSAALAAPALVPVAPTGETIKIENNASEIPALADGTATAKGVTLLYFSENATGVFVVKGEQVEEVA